jgi:hypothetical protein
MSSRRAGPRVRSEAALLRLKILEREALPILRYPIQSAGPPHHLSQPGWAGRGGEPDYGLCRLPRGNSSWNAPLWLKLRAGSSQKERWPET